ncbi:MAG: preprotein translocase subunit SecG [Saezia sp.]
MSGYFIVFLVIQVIAAVAIIILTLLQQGKGADMGAAFGSGSAGSLFGSSGSANFLTRMTSAVATVFFVTTMAMAYISSKDRIPTSENVLGGIELPTQLQMPQQVPTTEVGSESSSVDSVNQIPRN